MTGIKVRRARACTFRLVHHANPLVPTRLSLLRPLAATNILEFFATARRLRPDGRSGGHRKPLRDRNLALLTCGPIREEPSALHRAALDLGLRVAVIGYGQSPESRPQDVDALARALGQLYDAIDCGSLPAAAMREIEKGAGVPVYDGLDLDHHPLRALADLMTLHEHSLSSSALLSIRILGDADTARGRTFVSAARSIGFDVLPGGAVSSASNDATFVVDATRSKGWTLRMHASPLDDTRREENHRCMLQAILLDTIARG
nr:hypothetical protein [Variovorax sp. dw_308]